MPEEWPAALDRGMAGRPHAGETRSGDLAVFVPTAAGALACVIDGLGHGPEAADAAELCADVVRATRRGGGAGPDAGLPRGAAGDARRRDDRRLVRPRTLAAVVGRRGNVDARLVRSGPEQREEVALVFGGVLGYRLPRVRPATMSLERGDLLVMITDGIDGAISPALAGGGAAQTLASRILDTHGKGTDDALVVVIRYR